MCRVQNEGRRWKRFGERKKVEEGELGGKTRQNGPPRSISRAEADWAKQKSSTINLLPSNDQSSPKQRGS